MTEDWDAIPEGDLKVFKIISKIFQESVDNRTEHIDFESIRYKPDMRRKEFTI